MTIWSYLIKQHVWGSQAAGVERGGKERAKGGGSYLPWFVVDVAAQYISNLELMWWKTFQIYAHPISIDFVAQSRDFAGS